LKVLKKEGELAGIVLMLYQQSVCNKITRLLVKCNIKAVHICVKKNIHMLRAIKDKKGLKVTGI
jgi:hypothetical protein